MGNTTFNSVKWNGINSVVTQFTTILTGIILMRLLDPSAFGLIGMITVFTGFLNTLRDSGLGASLIYKEKITKLDKDTVFWFNFLIGLILFVGFYLSSGLIANYYNETILEDLVKVFSLSLIFSSISSVQFTLLKKQLDFKKIFKVELLSIIISTILTIIAAYNDYGVWSLIIMHLCRSLISSISVYLLRNYWPSLKFSYSLLKEHFDYSFPVLGTKSFNYWTRNADNFFIGRMLGSTALGFYSRAYFFITMPTQRISSIVGNVLFPSLSKLKGSKQNVAELLLKSMRVTAFITFPLLGGLIVLASPFVIITFGDQWKPMIVTLQILSILSLFESILVFTTTVFYSQGATKLNFKLSVIFGACNILAFYFGSLYSIELVATLLLIIYIIFQIPKLYFVTKLIDLKIVDILKNSKTVFFINIISMSLVSIVYNYVFVNLVLEIKFLIGILLYVILFSTLNYFLNKNQLIEFLYLVKKLLK